MTESSQTQLSPEQYLARQKAAFRVAFDYLTAHFPPEEDDGWWENAAKDAEYATAVTAKHDELTMELILGVYNYLEKEWERRYRRETDN